MSQQESGTTDEQRVQTDSGERDAATIHENTDYLEAEVNILRPSTQFMRDHLRLIWIGFFAWVLVIFGPVTATYFAQDFMTSVTFLGFPLHYFLVAVGGPGGALVLSVIYSWRRDKLDQKYGIDHSSTTGVETSSVDTDQPAATDGGVDDTAGKNDTGDAVEVTDDGEGIEEVTD